MRRPLDPVLLIVGLLAAAPAGAQAPLEKRIVIAGENPQARNRLQALDRQMAPLASADAVGKFVAWSAPAFPLRSSAVLAAEGGALEKWEQALEEYLKLLDDAGDALVPPLSVNDEPAAAGQRGVLAHVASPSVQMRRLVHLRIAALPPSILELYRLRVDAQAKKLLQEGKDQRSPRPLRRLVEEFFCSRFTDQALDFLGDLAFEEGNFEDALTWWRLLALPPGEQRPPRDGWPPSYLLFPRSNLDPARVRAKEVLAYGFLNQIDRAKEELGALRKLHPLAKGLLAGADGLYADIVEKWIERLTENGPATNHQPWTTFAGNPARNRALAVCPSTRLWVDGPTWKVRLPDSNQPADARTSAAALMAYHPLVVGSQVLIAGPRAVTGYDLFTGRQLFHFVVKDAGPEESGAGEGRYTLTAWNKRVFARLGRQSLGPKTSQDKGDGPSTLVCLDLAGPQPGGMSWQIQATKPDNSPAFFEGAPLGADGRVFSAVSWVVGQQTHTALACYDAQTGQRRWWQEICETPEFEVHPEPRKRQHLLTLGGGRLYYCSHAGAVIALDPWTGHCLWATRYRSRGPKTQDGPASPRELAPGVFADGRLYLAPLDADRVFCLDATGGRLLWECPGVEVVHLLGVSRGRVYFTTPRGLQCLKADTGTLHDGWMQPAEGKLPGLGRGLLAGSWLLWPTQDPKLPLRGVTLADGNQERFAVYDKPPARAGAGRDAAAAEPEYMEPTMLRLILPGNMAFGQDCLVVAGRHELAAYVPQKYFLKEREEDFKGAKTVQRDRPPLALYRLALAQADAGMVVAAEKNLERLRNPSKAPQTDDNWTALSMDRSAELRGLHKSPWKFALPDRENTDAVFEGKYNRPSKLDLPLQKTLDVSANHVQSLARTAAVHAGLVLGQQGEDVFCLDVLAGQMRWRKSLLERPFHKDQTLWLASFANVAVRADPERLVGLDLARGDAKHLWTLSVPLKPATSYFLDGDEPRRLSNPFAPAQFCCNDRSVFFMVDQRLLVAVNPLRGEIVWLFWAPGGQIRTTEGGGRFQPHYTAGDRFVLVQTTADKRLILDSQTGQLLHESSAARPWPLPPLALDDQRFVFSEEAGRVLLLDAATGLVSWTYEPAEYTSVTGSAAQVFGDKARLLALVPRNIGPDLVRLDPDRGTAVWRIALLPGDFDVRTAALDDDAVFFAQQNILQARSLGDGALLWKKKLPGRSAGWKTIRVGGALLVYPHDELQVPWLPIGHSPFAWASAYQSIGKFEQERAVLVIDPKTGHWMQRLPLREGQGPITLQMEDNRLVVWAGGTMSVFHSAAQP